MNNTAIKFEDHRGIIHMQALRGMKWAASTGVNMTYDDMFQEASIAFLYAAKGYDESTGNKFSTYFTMAAFSQFRKTLGLMSGVKNLNADQREEMAERKRENERRGLAALPPLDACSYEIKPVSFEALNAMRSDDFSESFEASLPSMSMTPEEIYESRQTYEENVSSLSPLAKLMVEWLMNPPQEMLDELKKQRLHADTCDALNIKSKGSRDGISIGNVSKFLKLASDVTEREVHGARIELENLMNRLTAGGNND